MSTSAVSAATRSNGRDIVATLKNKARNLRDAGLPKAASATESIGKAISGFALARSKTVAKSLRTHAGRQHREGISSASLLQAAPLLRVARRFALRNPAVLVATGAAIALVGYAAWKRQRSDDDAFTTEE